LEAEHNNLDVDIRTSALVGTPFVQSVHDYYPFVVEDGGRLAPMSSAELVDRLAILVEVRRFHGMGVVDARCLLCDTYVCMQHFVRRTAYVSFRLFWGMCGEYSCNIFQLPFMVLWISISMTLCMRAVLMLLHAFVFLGLRFFPLLSLCLAASSAFSSRDLYNDINRMSFLNTKIIYVTYIT
jgi:hypothetical protein